MHPRELIARQNGIVLVIRNAPCGPQLANKHHYALPNETAGLLQGDRGKSRSVRMALAIACRSGALSTKVPSKSNTMRAMGMVLLLQTGGANLSA